ncbi:AGAP004970-PA-like protein [Anopheles sinensis]|uniref:AGAP004970-PA-like protein n=1 Tax=Anopheles sinensis TaxID=74873 RepID=A0A084WDZ3_ANOSI|nr:AGAP004970-PA-like protein [Anopheles sinensis]
MTTLCSPWGQGQRDEYPSKALVNFLYSPNFNTKDMDDILVEECNNRNTVYVLNSSYRYGNLDMIELFGSPAGRALTVNNKTAAEMSYGGKAAACGRKAPPGDDSNQLQQASSLGGLLAAGSISPTNIGNIRISSIDGTIAGRHLIESGGDFIRFASEKRPSSASATFRSRACSGKSSTTHQTDQPHRRNNLKMAKFWKLFDEDRLRKDGAGVEPANDDGPNRRSRWGVGSTLDRAEAADKSSNDLYSEAAQLLGIKCSLTDSCRCIDCQSQYFDCDDDFDAYSEYSDKSYDVDDNLYPHRAYYAETSPAGARVSDSAITNHYDSQRRSWDEPDGQQDFNGNECQHYLHNIQRRSSSLDVPSEQEAYAGASDEPSEDEQAAGGAVA